MTLAQKKNIISSIRFFQILPAKEQHLLAKISREKIFAPKKFLLQQSSPAKEIYLMYKGLVHIYISNQYGKIIPIRIKEAPYILGEMNLFDNLSTATIEVLQETHTLIFPKNHIKKLLHTYAEFSYLFLETMNEKLRAANIYTEQFISDNVSQRTLEILKTLAPYFPEREISLSHEALANIIGATRSRVTEALHKHAQAKLILLSHKKIKLF